MEKNLLLKFIVILFAIILWYQHVLMQEHVTELNIPIKLLNLSENLILDKDSKSQFPIQIKASGMDILFLKMSDTFLEIDGSNLKYGKNFIKISNSLLRYPKRFDLIVLNMGKSERQIITLDRIDISFKPFNICYLSTKDEEYFAKNNILSTNLKVEIIGPKSVLDSIKYIETEPISQKMVSGDNIYIKFIQPNEDVTFAKESVKFEVSKTKMTIRTITLIPIKYPDSANITIIPQKVSIMVSGPIELVNNLTTKNILAKLNYNKLLKSKSANITFELPPGVKLLEYTPNKIQILQND